MMRLVAWLAAAVHGAALVYLLPLPALAQSSLAEIAALLEPGQSMEWPGTSIGPIGKYAVSIQNPRAPGNIFHTIVWGGQAICPDGSQYFTGSGHAGYSGIEVFKFTRDGQWSLFRGNWKVPPGTAQKITARHTNNPDLILEPHNPDGPFWGVYFPWPDNGTSPAGVHVYGGLFCDSKSRLWRVMGNGVWSGVTNTPFVWVTDTNDPDGWWEARTAAPGSGAVAGIEELPDGRLFIQSNAGAWIYDPAADSDAQGRASMEMFFDYWRLRDILNRIEARVELGDATAEEMAAAKKAMRDKKQEVSANALAGPYTPVGSGRGGPNAIQRLPDGKIIVIGRSSARNRVWVDGEERPMPFTGEVPPDERGKGPLRSAGLAYDSKRQVVWLWDERATRDRIYATRLKEVGAGFELELVEYPLDAYPVALTGPYESIRKYCATSQNRLVYHEDLDVLSWYCSVNQGFFVFRPPDKIRDPVFKPKDADSEPAD